VTYFLARQNPQVKSPFGGGGGCEVSVGPRALVSRSCSSATVV